MRNTNTKTSTTPANKKDNKTLGDSQLSDTTSIKSTKKTNDPPPKTLNRVTKSKSSVGSISSSVNEDKREIEDIPSFGARTPNIKSPKTEEFASLAQSFTKKSAIELSAMEIDYAPINTGASDNKALMPNLPEGSRLNLLGGESSSTGQAPTTNPSNPAADRGNTTATTIFSSLLPHIEPIFGTTEDIKAMKEYLSYISEDICSFCGGRGHFPNNCASKRNVDYAMRDTGNGAEWGKVKRKKKEEVYKIKRNIRREM